MWWTHNCHLVFTSPAPNSSINPSNLPSQRQLQPSFDRERNFMLIELPQMLHFLSFWLRFASRSPSTLSPLWFSPGKSASTCHALSGPLTWSSPTPPLNKNRWRATWWQPDYDGTNLVNSSKLFWVAHPLTFSFPPSKGKDERLSGSIRRRKGLGEKLWTRNKSNQNKSNHRTGWMGEDPWAKKKVNELFKEDEKNVREFGSFRRLDETRSPLEKVLVEIKCGRAGGKLLYFTFLLLANT